MVIFISDVPVTLKELVFVEVGVFDFAHEIYDDFLEFVCEF